MPKTRNDTIALAFRQLGINATGEDAQADEVNYADDILDGVLAELLSVQGLTLTFDIADNAYVPLSLLLASEIAPHYGVSTPIPRATAIARIRAAMIDDDRVVVEDLDEDGTLSDAEIALANQAAYY